jgi:hypothetical protein
MAGLIQQQMGAAPKEQEAQMPAEQMPKEQMPAGEMAEGEDGPSPDENNPVFQQALTLAYEALYKGEAAKDVAKTLKAAPDAAAGMADVAYNITSIVDERTDGGVPDELIALLGMRILEEVGEIADAAGLDPQPEDVAGAFKDMILRFLGEQGMDTTQLQQAMDQVDPAVFRQAAEQQG